MCTYVNVHVRASMEKRSTRSHHPSRSILQGSLFLSLIRLAFYSFFSRFRQAREL